MSIYCQHCNTNKPNNEVKLRGEWLCDACENLHVAARKEVTELLDLFIDQDNKRVGLGDWSDPILIRIKTLLRILWG